MTKRIRQQMNAQKNIIVELNEDDVVEDCISLLPEDLLINIISRLTLREATRTGILSNRWKCLWMFVTSLNFDASDMLNIRDDTLYIERSKYMDWVNEVLMSHRGSNVIKFRVCFDLRDCHKRNITKWIYTAIEKEVQELELNLHHYNEDTCFDLNGIYLFPKECHSFLKSPSGLYKIRNLRSLIFDTVHVSGEIIEFFINNCPLLDRLRIAKSSKLRSLKVVGSSIQLKYLEILNCYFVSEVKISTPNILSFIYDGSRTRFNVEYVPKLVDAFISEHSIFFGPNKCYAPHLQTLALKLYWDDELQFGPCDLPKLRHLTLNVFAQGRQSLVGLTHILEACPTLEKLTLKLQYDFHEKRKMSWFPDRSHQHLRVVELLGFVGRAIDIEFAVYLFRNATMLEKMIVEEDNYKSQSAEAMERAKRKLKKMVPEGVELVIN